MNIIKRIYNKIYTRLFLTKVIKHKYDTGVLPGYYIHLIEYYTSEEYKFKFQSQAKIIITYKPSDFRGWTGITCNKEYVWERLLSILGKNHFTQISPQNKVIIIKNINLQQTFINQPNKIIMKKIYR